MERISAGSNLIIEVQPESWRLLVDGSGSERVLVEAVPGEPLRYGASFGSRRQLPPDGMLSRDTIQRVVLGWSEDDAAWHLGLVLRGDLVTARGSRWCGLAHWYDPLANQHHNTAIQVGQALAEQLNCPFTFVPPRKSEGGPISVTPRGATRSRSELDTSRDTTADLSSRIAATTLEPVAELIPQPELPFKLDLWTLKQTDFDQVEFALSPAWGRGKLIRVGWNIIWLGVFIILTGTTLSSGIALPRPEFLVYLGIASSILLFLVILYQLGQTFTRTNRIVFDQHEGVRWLRGKRVRRTIPLDQIQEIYVSQIINKVGKRGKASQERAVHYGEINLLLKDGKFQSILAQQHTDDVIPVTDDPLNEETVVALTEYNARTRLQAAALKLARTLGTPAEYDKRLK